MKEVLMIHEVTSEILKLDLSKYILTFDDGLYSQFFYWDLIKIIPTTKIFFIPTGAIQLIDSCRVKFKDTHISLPSCREAMQSWLVGGDRSDYMSVGELKAIQREGGTISAHSHMHIEKYNDCFITRLDEFRVDSLNMMGWFKGHLDHTPDSYCFPFNKEYPTMRAVIKVETGIKEFYGVERKPVEDLL